MGKNEQTGKKAASSAGKVLNGTGTKKDSKRAAASALAQTPDKKHK
ncbi:MAG: hypothetical protein M1389_02945 [Chloroflexi bacterium]|nr:hypothetical protein [Chloroflexota bacterium]